MTTFTALYDANVLYPAPLRDLLVQLATTGLFRARWTDMIHEEWITSLLKNRSDLKREVLNRTRDRMNSAVLDCLVEDFESLIPSLRLPDENDRHILAAAIKGRADIIVTMNGKHFPTAELSKHSIQIADPDDFICDLLNLSPQAIYGAVSTVRSRLTSPPKNADEYLDILERNGLTVLVSQLRTMSQIL